MNKKITLMSAVLGVLALVAAVMSGNVAMALTIGTSGSDSDPNEDTPLAGSIADAPNKGIQQGGAGATGSAVDQAELARKEVEDYVAHHRAYNYPLHTHFLTEARQIKVSVKDPENYEVGDDILDATTTKAISNSTDQAQSVTLPLANLDINLFTSNATLIVEGVSGYDESGNADKTPLMLIVTEKSKSAVVVEAINGALDAQGNMYVPDIPAGTTIHICAPAMSESEVEVEPDNVLPRGKSVYLQKKVCAMTYTEFFEQIKKKALWNVQDIKNRILEKFRRKCTRSLLISAPSKRVVSNKRTGSEYAYTQNGILRQIRLGYQLGDTISYADLIGACRIIFGKYATTNEVTAYCGTTFIERLLNIDFTKHKDITFTKTQTIGIDISAFSCTFGTIKFVKELALDDLGLQECAIMFPMSEAKRFYYASGKTIKIDHAKGEGGEVREAKSEYYIEDDCLALTGMQSMIMGPKCCIGDYQYSTLSAILTVTSLPESADAGTVVYLTQADGTNGIGMYVYKNDSWQCYSGELNV